MNYPASCIEVRADGRLKRLEVIAYGHGESEQLFEGRLEIHDDPAGLDAHAADSLLIS